MKRHIIQTLKEWKTSPNRQPLLIRGARQTGKTHLIKKLGELEFNHTLSINFEQQKQFLSCFDSLNSKEIIQSIELLAGKALVPGKSLLFLDEIQECPKAIQALRYFYEEIPELHVIGTGSLLEFALSAKQFNMPVGRVQFKHLYPMTFSEMLLALGENKLLAYLQQLLLTDKIPRAVHQKLLSLLRLYFVLGGMPRVISLYAQHQNLLICRQTQADLLNTYRDDFAKYASVVQQRYCERVYSKAPELIAQHFKYTDIDPDLDYRSLKQAIHLLLKANILTAIYLAKNPNIPLSATQVEKNINSYFLIWVWYKLLANFHQNYYLKKISYN